ncbi:hypothetical protein E4N62_03620 [Streptomyces sp. MNU76]|uniref:hypothetical protein n=1 Tax=Streptomyces sp. MNU76 TaxID=2560026 RepID=UPI001E3E325A|nr:hypothetical protein [Streptomyces sp. MNU76]MCC9704427.1 hypothetical protein [Streptomyces sp. MNU76]
MSVAPPSAGVEPIVRRALAYGATAGTGATDPLAQAATTTLPNPLASSAAATDINPVPLPLRHDQRFAWVESDDCHQFGARHGGKCVNDVGASTTDLALPGQRTSGTATGFQWSRVRKPVSTPSRHP